MREAGAGVRMAVGIVLVLFPSPLLAQETGATVVLRGTRGENTYVAGGTVEVGAEIGGDLVGAGGTINVRQLVRGDVVVVGGSVNVSGRVEDDIRAAGGTITIGGPVGGDIVAAGGTITLAPEARVNGRVWLSGGRVAVAGRVGRELKVAAGSVAIDGEVDGDVRIAAGTIEIMPTARITGDLVYTSGRPARIDPAAQILGTVTRTPADLAERPGRIGRVVGAVARGALLGGLILGGVVLLLLWPGFTVTAARTIGRHPWKSLGLGLLLVVGTPIAAMVLMITLIGIPVGLALLALYAVALLVGYLTAAVFVGDLGVRRLGRGPELSTGRRVLSLVLGLILLALVGLVPILGAVIATLASMAGLGALGDQAYRRWSEARP